MTDIRLKEVSKKFGSFQVCHSIDLDIKAGEFITLLGSSGCGKTTTLNMVAGLEDSTSGDILIAGRRVNDLSPVERDVAMVFQNYALYPHMTVAQNIGFNLRCAAFRRRSSGKKSKSLRRLWNSATSWKDFQRSYPEASNSALRSAALWSASRGSSYSTSHSRILMHRSE